MTGSMTGVITPERVAFIDGLRDAAEAVTAIFTGVAEATRGLNWSLSRWPAEHPVDSARRRRVDRMMRTRDRRKTRRKRRVIPA